MYPCKICSLPDNYPGLHIESNGSCNFCNFYERHKPSLVNFTSLEHTFQNYMDQAKQRAKEIQSGFDCLVGFSGGKDSTYVIQQLKEKYHMRVLAFTYDNGFCTEYGRENIKNALKKLKVEHISFAPDKKLLQNLYRQSIIYSKHFCAACFHLMHYYSLLIASEHRIPLVINGRSRGQVLQRALDTNYLEPFSPTLGLKQFEYQMLKKVDGKLIQAAKEKGMVDFLENVDIQMLSYFMYHSYDAEEIKKFLVREIGWEPPEEGQKHPDCWAHEMAEYYHLTRQHFPQAAGELAVEVREGNRTREEAIEILETDRVHYQQVAPDYRKQFEETVGLSGGEG